MDHNAFLVWWLLVVPVILAIIDRFMMGGSKTSGAGTADGYIARNGGVDPATSAAATRAM